MFIVGNIFFSVLLLAWVIVSLVVNLTLCFLPHLAFKAAKSRVANAILDRVDRRAPFLSVI